MENREATFVPGLFKIFDEILVNAADNKMRDDTMKYIKVNIDRESGEISVENDGKGIPVEIHETEGVYVPQLVFGELLTGDNYNDGEDRVVGGRNGYGAKLANIFSTRFEVATCDTASGQVYKQVWLSVS
jgi:DNA topoisomerase II